MIVMKRVINFVKLQKIMLPVIIIFMLASIWTIFLPKSLPLGFVTPKNFNVGIDFQGGVSQRITVYSGASIEKIRKLAEEAGLGNNVQEIILNERQQIGKASSFLVKTGLTENEEKELSEQRKTQPDMTTAKYLGKKTEKLLEALKKEYGEEYKLTGADFEEANEKLQNGEKIEKIISSTDNEIVLENVVTESANTVSPASSKGMRTQAIMLIVFVVAVILLYVTIRFKFQFALAGVLALVHDALICCGMVSFFEIELDLTVVAAILTVIGYSINDTIVIFDRIRENLGIMKDEHPDKIFNVSLSQTLGRTLITSLTTLFPVVALFIFGGSNIKGFAFVIMIGIVAGTISTLFLASAVALAFERAGSKEKIKKLNAIQEKEERKIKDLQAKSEGSTIVNTVSVKAEDNALSKKTMMKLMGKKK